MGLSCLLKIEAAAESMACDCPCYLDTFGKALQPCRTHSSCPDLYTFGAACCRVNTETLRLNAQT